MNDQTNEPVETTKREQAKQLLADGHSTRFVAQQLGISRIKVCAIARTVKLKGNGKEN